MCGMKLVKGGNPADSRGTLDDAHPVPSTSRQSTACDPHPHRVSCTDAVHHDSRWGTFQYQ